MEVEAPAGGILRIVAREGSIVRRRRARRAAGVDEHDGEAIALSSRSCPSHADGPATERAAPRGERQAERLPAARRLAEPGVDLTGVHGTGPGGRIVVRDLGVAPPMPAVGREEAPETTDSGSGRPQHRRELAADPARRSAASSRPTARRGARGAAPTDAQVTFTDLLAFALTRARRGT
jgi:pyruvate/2-oxoglutarate dehydrogenase complex dihydrolipoamide acyltransferase (E2) component